MPVTPFGAAYPPYILWLIRDKKAWTWEQLCLHFGWDPKSGHTGISYLHASINRLLEAKLIDQVATQPAAYKVNDLLPKIQSCLGISISELAKHSPDSSMLVTPTFGLPKNKSFGSDLFVMMPFLQEMRPVFDDHITAVAKELGISVARADNSLSTRSVIEEVWGGIIQSKVLIADCTGQNSNVFYELGIAHAVGKPVVLITQDIKDVPFDIIHMRFIEYQYTPRGMKKFEDQLKSVLRPYFSSK